MIERYTEFSAVPKNVLALLENKESNPFLSIDWFELLADHCLSSSEQYAGFCCDAPPGALLLPLIVDGSAPNKFRSLSNYYTPIYAPLVLFKCTEPVFEDFFACLAKDHGVVELQLEPLVEELASGKLKRVLANAGFAVFPYFRFGNWYLKLEGRDFDNYYNGLSSQLRNTIARKRKKLVRETNFEFRLYQGAENLDQALEAYWKVYNASWKQDEPYPDFINSLVILAARRGWLRLGVIYVGEEPAAVQFWLVSNQIAYVYKLAYDKKYSKYSPGSILSYELFKHVIDEDKVIEIDYLMGDDAYKRDWMEHRREYWGIYAVNSSSWRGKYLAYKEQTKNLLKRLLR